MKCVMIVLGGAADRPGPGRDGRTPLAVARTPTLDALAERGKVGRVRTIPDGCEPTLANAIQTLLGYPPTNLVRGEGPFEAVGLGAAIGAGEVAYRLVLVTTLDGALVDPTAGGIGTAEATELLKALSEPLAALNVDIAVGRGHRHVLIVHGRGEVAATHPPSAVVGREMEEFLPEGNEGSFLRGLMERAHVVLADHEVNRVRVDLEENPADGVWPYGGGRLGTLPSLPQRLGMPAALFSDDPLVTGLAVQASLSVREGDGAGPTAAGILDALEERDLVIAYLSGPAEASIGSDAGPRVRALESIDRDVLAPLVQGLEARGPYRILVTADRVVPLAGRSESDPVPFLLVGDGVTSVRRFGFDEESAKASDLSVAEGHLLLDYLLARPARSGAG